MMMMMMRIGSKDDDDDDLQTITKIFPSFLFFSKKEFRVLKSCRV